MATVLSHFSFPTDIHFGVGARRQVASGLASLEVRRPLVVTDRGVSSLALFSDLVSSWRGDGLEPEIFDGVAGNPVATQVVAGVEAYHGHRADGIIGVGGGAALDVAKAIGLMATHDGDLFDYEDGRSGARAIEDRLPPWVALPTTAGTGSEVGRSAVIADDVTHVKRIIFSPYLLASAVYADPELTVGLPAAITAATGFDAITHNVEAYLARDYHPICDGIALEGLRLGASHLGAAVAQPADLEARGAMLMSSMMGAIAFQKGLGLVHSAAHALGSVADLHHGLANALMIDHALTHNVEAVPERFETMAITIGLRDASPAGLLAWLTELKAEVGLPAGLAGLGLDPGQVEELARAAEADGCHLNGPRPVSLDDFRSIFTRAMAV